jgi:hypothetical protein
MQRISRQRGKRSKKLCKKWKKGKSECRAWRRVEKRGDKIGTVYSIGECSKGRWLEGNFLL